MTTTIKITALSEIGSNLATSTVVPVVNMAGTPTTQKTTVGNIANLALTQAGNAYPAAALATLAQTVTNAAQPNITSVGTLTGLTSTGNVTFTSAGNVNLGPVGNVKITGGSSGQILSTDGAGNLSWVNDSTSYGNSNVAAYLPTYTGDLTAANIVVTGNITPSANVTYNLGNNTNRWNNLYLAGNTIVLGDAVLTANANALIVQTPDGGNFVLEGNANTTFGNIVGVNLDGNSSNILFGNGSFATPPSAAEVDVLNTNGLTTVFYPTFVENRANGQIIRADVDLQYRSDTNTLTVGNIAANNLGNIASVNLNGNGQTWLAGNGTFANINVPNVGNIATINIDGNASNILYGNGAFAASPSVSLSGDGGNLSNINGANVTGIVANANITDYINIGRVSNNFSYHVILSAGDCDKDMHVDDSDNLQYNPNSGLLTAVRVDAQNFVGNLFYSSGYAVANVDGIGNIATINLSGNGSQVLAGNGTWVAQSGGGNASLPLANGSSNINIATANGNVTITANASNTWTFDNTGNIVLAGGNSVIQSIANSSLDPTLPNVSTMTLTPDANYNSQVLVLDPTAPGHIHLRAYAFSNIDDPAANIFLGGEQTAFEVTSGPNNVAKIHSGNLTWTFSNNSGASVIDLPGESYIRSNQDTVNIQSLDANGIGRGIYIGTNGALYFWDGNSQSVSLQQDNTNANLTAIGNASITSNVSTWTFGTDGNLTLPSNTFAVNYANGTQVSLNGLPAGSNNQIQYNSNGAFGASANYKFTDTVGGGSVEVGNELLLLGNGTISTANSNINIQPAGNLVVTASAYNWTFDTNGVLTLPGNLISSGASPAPTISGFSSIGSIRTVTTPQPLASLTATAGARAFASDANLVAAGNFGANVSNGGANTVPVWSDGTNWYIG